MGNDCRRRRPSATTHARTAAGFNDPVKLPETTGRQAPAGFMVRKASLADAAAKGVRHMLNYIFGFNARMGRLAFFFCTFVVGLGFMMLVYGVTGNAPASGSMDVLLAQASSNPVLVIAFYGMLVICFMLQSMRVRDMGWDPVCVMAAWVALMVLDRAVAGRFPEYALTYQHTATVVGAAVNGVMNLVLLFWPGGGRVDEASSLPRESGSDGMFERNSAPAAAGSRVARIASGEFGGKTR
ncbi:DUF805 domain-containing protein [Bradyrhizobium pachyrhizi]|uniref:DUF805 domain-containing protein n=1 Tax=Bradyrhizobium pachyrhizi TaxID=280333 RepID=A0A844T5F0_9BRAD|nr:DUF805 domain-containing protein [Bradyrhizobium pachyrhizi]MVT71264.1 DUF805 domain-containing protein [Bradyrhizobium pachyrhizi]WFU56743.1 DUF805 domain-containing protein [Bradyrhizobium pachyrhizi]